MTTTTQMKGVPRTIRRRLEDGARRAAARLQGIKDKAPAAAAAAAATARRADGRRVAQGPWEGMAFELDPHAAAGIEAAIAAAAAVNAAGLPHGAGASAMALAAADADVRAAARAPSKKKAGREPGDRVHPVKGRAGAGRVANAVRAAGHSLFQPGGGGVN